LGGRDDGDRDAGHGRTMDRAPSLRWVAGHFQQLHYSACRARACTDPAPETC
jgi:hypothetical protein